MWFRRGWIDLPLGMDGIDSFGTRVEDEFVIVGLRVIDQPLLG